MTSSIAAVLLLLHAAAPFDCAPHFEAARAVLLHQWHFLAEGSIAAHPADAARAFEADAAAADSPAACADVIRRYLAALGDGHLRLRAFPDEPARGRPAGLRLGRLVPPQGGEAGLYVLAADTGAPGLGGLSPGAQVLEIDGVPAAERLAWLAARIPASTPQQRELRMANWALDGPAGTPVRLLMREADGSTRMRLLERPERPPAGPVQAREVSPGIGWIRLPTLADEAALRAFDEALTGLLDTRGLLLDLRGVDGGDFRLAARAGGRFLPRELDVADVRGRPDVEPPIAFPLDTIRMGGRRRPYAGHLVVLVDAGCFGACEVLAGALQRVGRAVLVGPTATGGGGGSLRRPGFRWGHPAWREEWDFRTDLRYGVDLRIEIEQARAVARWPDGGYIARRGVAPDVRADYTLAALLAGRDEVLEEGTRVLRERVRAGGDPLAGIRAPEGWSGRGPGQERLAAARAKPFVAALLQTGNPGYERGPYLAVGARFAQALTPRAALTVAGTRTFFGPPGAWGREFQRTILAAGVAYRLRDEPLRLTGHGEVGPYWQERGSGWAFGVLGEAARSLGERLSAGLLLGTYALSRHGGFDRLFLFGASVGR